MNPADRHAPRGSTEGAAPRTRMETAPRVGGRGRLFSSSKRALSWTTIYSVLLLSSVEINYRLYMWAFNKLGRKLLTGSLGAVFLALGFFLVFLVLACRPRRIGSFLSLGLIVATGLYCLDHLSQPANRLHLLEYTPLTVLVFDSLGFYLKDRFIYVWTFFIVSTIGLLDESIQSISPDRHFDTTDLVLNAATALLVLAFIGFALGEENYPLPARLRRRHQTPNRPAGSDGEEPG